MRIAYEPQHGGVEVVHGGVEAVGLVDADGEGDADAWAVDDGSAPEAVVVPAGLASDRFREDAHAEVAGAGGVGLAEHRSQGGGALEDVAAEQGAIEAADVVDGRDEAAATVE